MLVERLSYHLYGVPGFTCFLSHAMAFGLIDILHSPPRPARRIGEHARPSCEVTDRGWPMPAGWACRIYLSLTRGAIASRNAKGRCKKCDDGRRHPSRGSRLRTPLKLAQ